MRNVLHADFGQTFLLPPCVEDWIPAEHPARFLREVVGQYNLSELGFQQPDPVEGGTCYGAELLLSVWLYGYFSKLRSSRALERACQQDLAFIWLSGNHRPDHNALWRFWNANKKALRALFKQTVRLALQMDLVGFAFEAIDGTKIMAACATRQTCDRKHLERVLARLDKQLDEQEKAIAEAGPQPAATGTQLPAALAQATRLREKVRAALAELDKGERKHCHPQEREAVRVPLSESGSSRFGYNAQAVVDAKAQIITAEELLAESNDMGLATTMAQKARENTGAATSQSAADVGYCTVEDIAAAQAAGLDLLMPLRSTMVPVEGELYHTSQFQHDVARDVVVCPQGQSLVLRRERAREGRVVREYANAKACRACPVRAECTKAADGRRIELSEHDAAVAQHRQKMSTTAAKESYQRRSAVVEPIFARLKSHGAFRRFTVRGVEQVRVQWSLLCSALNLQRIYGFWRAARVAAATVLAANPGTLPGGADPGSTAFAGL